MTVETTLQYMFDEFPDLFSTRADCFDHLFCTIGDGYEWVHGQLVECGTYGDADEIDYLNPPTKRACQSAENIAKRRKEDKELHDLKRENDLEDGLPDIGSYDPDKRHWYPLSKHSHIMNLPDDIRDDWREAANECLKMMAENGVCLALFENGELKIPDSMGKGDAVLVGWKGKPAKSETIFYPFIPTMLVETDKEREARQKRERAGKKYARVKLSNGNAHHRGKRGQILDSANGKSLLEIETLNSCSPSGCHTLMGPVYPYSYEKIWFEDSELERFEEYDGNGEPI